MVKIKAKDYLVLVAAIIVCLMLFELFSRTYYSDNPYKVTFIDDRGGNDGRADIDFLVMGDSVCEGDLINDNSYGKKLEQALDGRSTSISCHMGYELLDHFIRFNEIISEYRPKNVILLITMYNDFRKDFFMFNKDLFIVEPLRYTTVDSSIITSSKVCYHLLNNLKSAYFLTSKVATFSIKDQGNSGLMTASQVIV